MSVAIIDYGSGNLRSAAKAFERAIREAGMSRVVSVTADPETVRRADHVVLPGVGAFADCKSGLEALPGMIAALEETVIGKGRPFLGICVGMQLLATTGLEHGAHSGLGWIKGEVVALDPADTTLKVPQMGWNDLRFTAGAHPVLENIAPGRHAYFVHSFHFVPEDCSHVLASVDYGGSVAAMIGRDNIVGLQFHPEKSQETGLSVITNFLRWRP